MVSTWEHFPRGPYSDRAYRKPMTFRNLIKDFKSRPMRKPKTSFTLFVAGDSQNDRAATLGLALANVTDVWKVEKENLRFVQVNKSGWIKDMTEQVKLIETRLADILSAKGLVNITADELTNNREVKVQDTLTEAPAYL